MDPVDILIFYVVGFCVTVFLIVDSKEEIRKSRLEADQSRVTNDSQNKTRTWLSYVSGSVKASDEEEEEENRENQLVSKNSTSKDLQEIREAATENPAIVASSERLGSCRRILDVSKNTTIDICKNIGVSEFDDKREEESFDDWERIERTELEKTFGEAVIFVNCKSNAYEIDGDVKLTLYGLQKVALEGTCHGSQPMILNILARTKWNAWQKLGNMSRETAMEKYVNTSRAHSGVEGGVIVFSKDRLLLLQCTLNN